VANKDKRERKKERKEKSQAAMKNNEPVNK
jgi:hypothetical protein